uniref:Homer scaffold protein 3b n=1 Tax=Callorhinchus milii TaxID=7868 RepID=A0A4W3HSB2_CALMI
MCLCFLGRPPDQPIFSARAHVFQIDPATKRNWIPASKHAVTVSYFYDSNRNVYRIISVGGTKVALVSGVLCPSMLCPPPGPAPPPDPGFFAEKFQEVKEAARLAREKSQDKIELTNPALDIAAPQDLSCGGLHSPPLPPASANGPGGQKLYRGESSDGEGVLDGIRLKAMFSQSSVCEPQWEMELFGLQESNAKLVQALHESNVNVEQWKKQLSAYKEETEKLRERVTELELQGEDANTVATQNTDLSQSVEELETLLKEKEEEIHLLRSQKSDVNEIESDREEALLRLQAVERRNVELEQQLREAEETLGERLGEGERVRADAHRLLEILDIKLYELNDLRQNLAKLAERDPKS